MSEHRIEQDRVAGEVWEDEDFNTCGLDLYGNQEDVVEVEEEDTEPRIFRAWEEKWERRKMNRNVGQYLHTKIMWKYGGLQWMNIEGKDNPEAGPPCLITAHPEEMHFKEGCRRYRYLVVGMKEGLI